MKKTEIKTKIGDSRREGTVCKLLHAATKVFGKWGYDGATTKMVAAKAGINEALITRYFGGKSGLVAAVILESIKKQEDLYNVSEPPTTVEAEISGIIKKMRGHAQREPDLMKVLISRAAFDPKLNKEIHRKISIYGSPVLRARLQTLKDTGKIRAEIDLDTLTFSIWLFSVGNIFLLYMNPPNLDLGLMEKASELYARELAKSLAPVHLQ
jgi:AcrR family transcriptional regulator